MRPSPLGPTTKGVGSAQAKEVRDCSYLEAHRFVLRDLHPEVTSVSGTWILLTVQPASLFSGTLQAWLHSPLPWDWSQETLDLSQQHAEPDTHCTQATQISSSRFGLAASATPLDPSLPVEPLLTGLLWVVEIVFQLLLTHLNPVCFSKSVLLPFTIPPLHILCHLPHVPTSTHSHTLLETVLWGYSYNCFQSSPPLSPHFFFFLRLQCNGIHYR